MFTDDARGNESLDRRLESTTNHVYACDTPGCDNLKTAVIREGYVCHECAAARDESVLLADGGVDWHGLTGLERDCLEVIAILERDGEAAYALAIERELEGVAPATVYSILEHLEAAELVERARAGGAIVYRSTPAGENLLESRAYELAAVCGLTVFRPASDLARGGRR